VQTVGERPEFLSAMPVEAPNEAIGLAVGATYVWTSVGSPSVGCRVGGGWASAGTGTIGVHSLSLLGVAGPESRGLNGSVIRVDPSIRAIRSAASA